LLISKISISFPESYYKKVTFSLSDPPRTAPVAFLGSSNFFMQRILNFASNFLSTYCLLIGQKVNFKKWQYNSKFCAWKIFADSSFGQNVEDLTSTKTCSD
jgi:hypothetical protein